MSLCASFLPPTALVLSSPAACRFLSAGEFVHLALASYYAACQSAHPPEGEVWAEPCEELGGLLVYWSSPEGFKDDLLREVDERLWRTAIARGYALEQPWPEPDEADAVGEAHGDALALLTANPLSLVPERQQLPAQESVMHDQPSRSAVL